MDILKVLSDIFSFVLMLAAVGFILYLSYAVTKKLGGSMTGGMSKNMRVVDRLFVGRDKSIVVVRVGEKDYLLGLSQNTVTLLTELSEGQIMDFSDFSDEETGKVPGEFLETLKKKWKK